MSNRTLIELNHDYILDTDEEKRAFGEAIQRYMQAADPKQLPPGVTFKNFRHHSDPCPLEKK